MNVRSTSAAAFAAALLVAPLAARADQAMVTNQIQTAVHQQMVINGIQQGLQTQLQTQQTAIQDQRRLVQLQGQGNLNGTLTRLQQLEVQQLLLLIQSELRDVPTPQQPKQPKP